MCNIFSTSNDTSSGSGEDRVDPKDLRDYRLPRTFIPENYELHFDVNMEKFTHTSHVHITGRITKPTKKIVLNADGLKIVRAELRTAGNRVVKSIGKVRLQKKLQRAVITFPEEIAEGKWELYLEFQGEIKQELKGFYRSFFKDASFPISEQEHRMATTQFEPACARKAFPCFDEPDFKAVFDIRIVCDSKYTVLSNGEVEEVTSLASIGKKMVQFAPTIKMSSYLVAFVIAEFESSKPIKVGNTEVRVWARPGQIHNANFALKAARMSLNYFGKYFRKPYPGKKIDLVAIPDFSSGAMENFGCITFRETALLVNPSTASQDQLARVAEVVAHELAHMWFGDLVTMEWWVDLWLNEAFATFLSWNAIDQWKPEWRIWDQTAMGVVVAKRIDGMKATRPIAVPLSETLKHSDRLEGLFDAVTYRKGAKVLKMLEMYLGAKAFRKGMVQYIADFEYKNAQASDFYNALEVASKKPVTKIMTEWIEKSGYPLVTVDRVSSDAVILRQGEFKYLPEFADKSKLWPIPVKLRAKTKTGLVEITVMLNSNESIVSLGEELEWVVVNADDLACVRVHYKAGLRQDLCRDVMSRMKPIERLNFVNDAWACTIAGFVSPVEFVQTIQLFSKETDPNVWRIIDAGLHYFYRFIPETLRSQFEAMVSSLALPTIDELGWNATYKDSIDNRQVRGMVISLLATIGNHAETHQIATGLVGLLHANELSVDGNLHAPLLAGAAANGSRHKFNEFVECLKKASTPQEEEVYRHALVKFRDPEVVDELLSILKASMSLKGSKNSRQNAVTIRSQDAPTLIAELMANRDHAPKVWSFIKENWRQMLQVYAPRAVTQVCQGATTLVSEEMSTEAKALLLDEPELREGREKALDQHLEQLEINRRVALALTQNESQLAERFAVQA
jgi:puromycin-sensitive aminopeptidase